MADELVGLEAVLGLSGFRKNAIEYNRLVDQMNRKTAAFARSQGQAVKVNGLNAARGALRGLGREYDNLSSKLQRSIRLQQRAVPSTASFRRAQAAVRQYSGELVQLGNRAQTASRKTGILANSFRFIALTSVTAGILGIARSIGQVVQAGAELETVVDAIQAIGQLSDAQASQVGDLAINLGIDPNLRTSAIDAAKAIEVLFKNGLTLNEVLGSTSAVIQLANATGIQDFAVTADIATDVIQIFELGVNDLNDAVNDISGTVVNSKFDINDFRLALGRAGETASLVNQDFEDFSVAIASIAPSFSSGQRAGTSYKRFLQQLVPTTARAREAFEAAGFFDSEGNNRFFDASGDLVELEKIVSILSELQSLSSLEQLELLKPIFGTDAASVAAAFVDTTIEDIERLRESINSIDAGDQAAQRVDNLSGRYQLLRDNLNATAVTISNRVNPGLKLLVEDLTNLTSATNEWLRSSEESNAALGNFGQGFLDGLRFFTGGLADETQGIFDGIRQSIQGDGDAILEYLAQLGEFTGTPIISPSNSQQIQGLISGQFGTVGDDLLSITGDIDSLISSFNDLNGVLDESDVFLRSTRSDVQGLFNDSALDQILALSTSAEDLLRNLERVNQETGQDVGNRALELELKILNLKEAQAEADERGQRLLSRNLARGIQDAERALALVRERDGLLGSQALIEQRNAQIAQESAESFDQALVLRKNLIPEKVNPLEIDSGVTEEQIEAINTLADNIRKALFDALSNGSVGLSNVFLNAGAELGLTNGLEFGQIDSTAEVDSLREALALTGDLTSSEIDLEIARRRAQNELGFLSQRAAELALDQSLTASERVRILQEEFLIVGDVVNEYESLQQRLADIETFSSGLATDSLASFSSILLENAGTLGLTTNELEAALRATGDYTEEQFLLANASLDVERATGLALDEIRRTGATGEEAANILRGYTSSIIENTNAQLEQAAAAQDAQDAIRGSAVGAFNAIAQNNLDPQEGFSVAVDLDDELYRAAEAAGATASELAVLGVALGRFTEEQAAAALKAAILQESIANIARGFVESGGAQSIESLIGNVRELSETLDREFALAVNTDGLNGALAATDQATQLLATGGDATINIDYDRAALDELETDLGLITDGDNLVRISSDAGVTLDEIDELQLQVSALTEEVYGINVTNDAPLTQADIDELRKSAEETADGTYELKFSSNADGETNEVKALKSAIDSLPSTKNITVSVTQTGGVTVTPSSGGSGLTEFNQGGLVPLLPGASRNKDSILAALMPGEYVLTPEMVNAIGLEELERLRAGKIPGFQDGGPVDLRRSVGQLRERRDGTLEIVGNIPLTLGTDEKKVLEELERRLGGELEIEVKSTDEVGGGVEFSILGQDGKEITQELFEEIVKGLANGAQSTIFGDGSFRIDGLTDALRTDIEPNIQELRNQLRGLGEEFHDASISVGGFISDVIGGIDDSLSLNDVVLGISDDIKLAGQQVLAVLRASGEYSEQELRTIEARAVLEDTILDIQQRYNAGLLTSTEALDDLVSEFARLEKAVNEIADIPERPTGPIIDFAKALEKVRDRLADTFSSFEFDQVVDEVDEFKNLLNDLLKDLSKGFSEEVDKLPGTIKDTGDELGKILKSLDRDMGETFDRAVGTADQLISTLERLDGSMVSTFEVAASGDLVFFDLNQAMFDQAKSAGANAVELAALGLATGQLTDEQARAALEAAVLQERIGLLAKRYAEGGLSVEELISQSQQAREELSQAFDTAAVDDIGAVLERARIETEGLAQEINSLDNAIVSPGSREAILSTNDALFEQVKAAGASAVEIAALGLATGKLTEEQARSALESAVLQERIKLLAKRYAEGGISAEILVGMAQKARRELSSAFDTAAIEGIDNVLEKAGSEAEKLAAELNSLNQQGNELGVPEGGDEFSKQLFDQAQAAGASAVELAALGLATGQLTDEQVRSALEAAILQEQLKILAKDYASGALSAEELVAKAKASREELGSVFDAAEANSIDAILSASADEAERLAKELERQKAAAEDITPNTDNIDAFNQSLFDQAKAAGANIIELAALGLATGQLSEEQARAALEAAILQEQVRLLAVEYANGNLSADELIQKARDSREELAAAFDQAATGGIDAVLSQAAEEAANISTEFLNQEVALSRQVDAMQELIDLQNAIDPALNLGSRLVAGSNGSLPGFKDGGPVDGAGLPGGLDNVLARLTKGEFVFTKKAVDNFGAGNLMNLMKQAERGALDNSLFASMARDIFPDIRIVPASNQAANIVYDQRQMPVNFTAHYPGKVPTRKMTQLDLGMVMRRARV